MMNRTTPVWLTVIGGLALVAAVAVWTAAERLGPSEAAEGETTATDATVTPGITLRAGAARRFDASGLNVGDLFPAVDVFDSEGQPFNTSRLKGRYTVLVSGCLT